MLNRHLSGGTSPDGPPEGATSRSWFQLNKAHFSQSWRSCRQSWVSPPTPHPRELCSQHVAGDLPSVHAPDRDVDGSPATFKFSAGSASHSSQVALIHLAITLDGQYARCEPGVTTAQWLCTPRQPALACTHCSTSRPGRRSLRAAACGLLPAHRLTGPWPHGSRVGLKPTTPAINAPITADRKNDRLTP
jgi:hypothetical protein